ncbi:MAG TPA: tetratricopeptide repeat protein [Candidatus Acidoferrum sp.]|nr:tetratricopeptide repeat protein [Candidatus Acidoferrum sp.]
MVKTISFCLLYALALLCSSCVPPEERAAQSYETGRHDFDAGQKTAALKEFSRAVKLDPDSVPAHMGRAATELALNDNTRALADYTEVTGLDPSNEPAFFFSGLCEMALKDFASAVNNFNTAVALNPNDANAYLYLGIARAKLLDWDDALLDFGIAIRLDPANELAYSCRAGAELIQKDDGPALADASKAIESDPTDYLAYRFRAHAKSSLKDRAGALADMDKAVELRSADASSYTERASIKILWDDFPGADADLQRALQMDPKNADAYAYRGNLERKLGNTDAALADFRRALQFASPAQAAEIDEFIGLLQSDLSQWNAALESYNRSLALDSGRDYVHFYIFLVRTRLGQAGVARTELEDWLQSVPFSKAHSWATSIGRFLAGDLAEQDFLAQATATAKQPADVSSQTCEADYYIGMKYLLAGDKAVAADWFGKALATKEDNYSEFRSAGAELRALKSN